MRQVAKDLDLTETALGEWVPACRCGRRQGSARAVTSEERAELFELRKRVKRLKVEREILNKATAFFAKESG